MFAFTGSDFANGCKYRALLCATKFNSSLCDYTKFFCFFLPAEKRKVSIKQRRVDGQVASQLCSMRCEHRFNRHFLTVYVKDGKACHPFMKMGNYRLITPQLQQFIKKY